MPQSCHQNMAGISNQANALLKNLCSEMKGVQEKESIKPRDDRQ